jgi:hypothetical protein
LLKAAENEVDMEDLVAHLTIRADLASLRTEIRDFKRFSIRLTVSAMIVMAVIAFAIARYVH